MKVLIIEDNDILRENIQTYLILKGVKTEVCESYEKSMYMLSQENFDVLILDLGLGSPLGDGITLCKQIREKEDTLPILILTARTLTEQKIIGLESGADDYMTKPFDYGELLARIKALSRRKNTFKGDLFTIGDIVIQESVKSVEKDKKRIGVSKLEFELLCYLIKNKGTIITKNELLEKVWGERDLFRENRSVDIYVGYLRKKLGTELIRTVRGVGYIID